MDEDQRAVQVQLAAGGDGDALQRLIVEYHEVLCATVEKALDHGVRRYVDPEDILQSAYVKAFKALPSLEATEPGAFYVWLETNAINELRNCRRDLYARKRDIGRELHGSAMSATSRVGLVERLTAHESTPSRRVAHSEAASALLSSLARLSDDQRSVIRLRFLEGKPVAEIAACLGKTEASVHALCRRGLQALRGYLVSISRYLIMR